MLVFSCYVFNIVIRRDRHMKSLLMLFITFGLVWCTGCGDDMEEINTVWNEITGDEIQAVYEIDFDVEDLGIERVLKEERKDYLLYEVTYEGVNKQKVTGDLAIPKLEGHDGPFPLIYYFPRTRETRQDTATIADLMGAEGWAVFATDKPRAPMQKENEMVSEMLVAADSQQAAVKNGLRGISVCESFPEIDRDHIIAMGGSYGTTSVLILTAIDPRIDMGITIVGSAGRMEEQALLKYRPIYRDDLREKLIKIKSTEPLYFLPLIGEKPMLLINAKYDQNIRNVLVEKMQNSIKGPKKVLIVDRDHIFPLKIVMPDLIQWINENMESM